MLRKNATKNSCIFQNKAVYLRRIISVKFLLHKPHPRKELPEYQRKQLLEHLEQEGFL